jgi:hypothetical protein
MKNKKLFTALLCFDRAMVILCNVLRIFSVAFGSIHKFTQKKGEEREGRGEKE